MQSRLGQPVSMQRFPMTRATAKSTGKTSTPQCNANIDQLRKHTTPAAFPPPLPAPPTGSKVQGLLDHQVLHISGAQNRVDSCGGGAFKNYGPNFPPALCALHSAKANKPTRKVAKPELRQLGNLETASDTRCMNS